MLSQLNKDIDYCTRVLGCNAEQTDELIQAAEALTINAEYFCEEWLFLPHEETEEGFAKTARLHEEDYLNIAQFNGIHWGNYNED